MAKSKWREPADFIIDRPNGSKEFVCVHFLSAVDDLLGDAPEKIHAGGFIVFAPGSPQRWKSTGSPLVHDWFHFKGNGVELLKHTDPLDPNSFPGGGMLIIVR